MIHQDRIKYKINDNFQSEHAYEINQLSLTNLKDSLKFSKDFNSRDLRLNDLKDIPILNKIISKHKKKIKHHSIDLIIRQIIRDIINTMVSDVIKTTQKNIKFNKIKNLKDVYESKKMIISFSSKIKKFDSQIKNFLRQKMYFHKNVKTKTNYGRKIIRNLFLLIKKNPKKYINISKYKNSSLERIICDYIAGMTDRYAINLYNKIK